MQSKRRLTKFNPVQRFPKMFLEGDDPMAWGLSEGQGHLLFCTGYDILLEQSHYGPYVKSGFWPTLLSYWRGLPVKWIARETAGAP